MNPWTGFSLYAAATIFVQNEKEADKCASNMANLEFLLAAMKAIGKRHTITTYFANQLEADIEESGILSSANTIPPSLSSSSFILERNSPPKTIHNLCSYVQAKAQVEPTLKGPLLAGVFARPEHDTSPRDSPQSALTSNMHSTPSSKNIEPPTESTTALSFFYSQPDFLKSKQTSPDSSTLSPQYNYGGQTEDFIMFPHDPNNMTS